MKICILGGGSSYVPELVERAIDKVKTKVLSIDQIALMDTDEERVKLVGELCRRMVDHAKSTIDIAVTGDSRKAIAGSAFVISQLRVDRDARALKDRIFDEKFPLKYGVIAQESTGAAGFSHALRAVPVVVEYARQTEELAPDAFFIINTNPQRVILEAVSRYSKAKVVGVCEHWRWTEEAICSVLNCDPSEIRLVVIGLQHLNWATRIYLNGEDVLPKVVDAFYKARYPDRLGTGPGPFEAKLIKSLGMIPNAYLQYYYYEDAMLQEMMKARKTRGEKVLEHYERFFNACRDLNVKEKPKIITTDRAAHRWGKSMMDFIQAVTNDENRWLLTSVRNKGALEDMDPDAMMEIPTIVNKSGAHPLALGEIPLSIRGLIHATHEYSVLTAKAAMEGSYNIALVGLMTNPLVHSYGQAKGILDEILEEYRDVLPNFFK